MKTSFSKRKAYTSIISALQDQSVSTTEQSISNFFGFGALKEILLPLDDQSTWTEADLNYLDDVREIHKALLLRFGEQGYKKALDSIRNSILSSFYTPGLLSTPILKALKRLNPEASRFLEPSAGTGNFVKEINDAFPDAEVVAIEKDSLTSTILKSRCESPNVSVINSGFEDYRSQKFDFVISNIPFGSISVYDSQIFKEAVPVKVKSTTRIHNYFFVKGLDNLKAGGYLAFITSNGLMDSPGNQEVRQYLMEKSDLVTAIRLPNEIFASAGTFPVTDLIVLKQNTFKKNLSDSEKAFVTSSKTVLKDDNGVDHQINLSDYFKLHPENALGDFIAGGQYSNDSLDMVAKPNENEESFSLRFSKLLQLEVDKYYMQAQIAPEPEDIQPSDATFTKENLIERKRYKGFPLKDGNLFIHKGKAGWVSLADSEYYHFKADKKFQDIERLSSFIQIRDTYSRLVSSEIESQSPDVIEALRSELNSQYDLFTFRYGSLNSIPNKKLFVEDPDGFKILALERKESPEKKEYIKADILTKRIHNAVKAETPRESLADAILLSLNAHNSINLEFISRITQRSTEELITEGLERELLFPDLNKIHESGHFVPKDVFFSGNVVKRIDVCEDLRAGRAEMPSYLTKELVDKYLDSLYNVKPLYLTREVIGINLGENWIPKDIYESFAEYLLDTKCQITFLESAGQYFVKTLSHSNTNTITMSAETANRRFLGETILEYAMADVMPRLMIKVSSNPDKYVPDINGMKNVEMKIKETKEAFERFLNERPEISERIERIYNTRVNNTVKRTFDGSHLQLADMKHFTPRQHQKDATWMILQQEGGIIDHVVGAGKTLVMAMSAMEMRRVGIAKKPMIICMKANVADVAKDFLKAYPDAKVLAPDPSRDFTPQKRKQIFASIANNDWDAIILTHDMFQRIPQSDTVKERILTQELKNLEDDLAILGQDKQLSKRVLKGLESRKNNLQVELSRITDSIQRDENALNFDSMGIDHIMVDESQQFKNLHYTTRHQSVAGLGDPKGSIRALNLELAIRTIQEKKGGDRGATFLSGTPISNSLVELYLLFKYLRPAKLSELGINSFDAWAKMYARKSTQFEFSVTNEVKMKERYREFIKVPELALFYSEIAHVVTTNNLPVDKPTLNHIIRNIDPTPDQVDYNKRLVEFTKTKNPAHIGMSFTKDEQSAFMLIATNLAKKMSLDMRLISPNYEYNSQSKIGILCAEVAKRYADSAAFKGTQLIFSDIGTPTGTNFNIYNSIKEVLISEYGIPPKEVQFIHDFETDKRKKDLFADINSGDVRIVIGSTTKMGVGVNVQKRLIGLHHIDIPWRPSDMEQRGGRGARQGNEFARTHWNNQVDNIVYCVNRTLDAYQFNILSNKQKFITQIKNNTADVRRIDEGALDEDGTMNYSEFVAMLSGNDSLLKKAKLEREFADEERNYNVFFQRKSEAQRQIARLTKSIDDLRKHINDIKAEYKPLLHLDLEEVGITMFNKQVLTDKKEIGSMLLREVDHHIKSFKKGDSVHPVLCRVDNFEMRLNLVDSLVYVKHSVSGRNYQYADGRLNTNPALAGRYIIDSLKRIPKIEENTLTRITEITAEIETYRGIASETYKGQDRLNDLKNQIEVLDQEIAEAARKADLEAKEAQGQEQIPAENLGTEVLIESNVEEPKEFYGNSNQLEGKKSLREGRRLKL